MQNNIEDFEGISLCGNLEKDLMFFKNIFIRDDMLRIRTINIAGTEHRCGLVFMDGMVSGDFISSSIIRPIFSASADENFEASPRFLRDKILYAGEIEESENAADMLRAILTGDTVIITDGSAAALLADTKGWRTRGIDEPANERILQGPREGFDEAGLLNIAMIKRKLVTPDLCVETLRIGRRSDTMVFVCYLGSLAKKKTVREVRRRIEKIDIDGVLDTNYISELIRDHKGSLLKTTGTTERPDIVAARLLEGRIAVVVDGTPVVLTIPYLFSENFQSDEDYYLNFLVGSIGRVLRFLCFFAAFSVPAVFVALSAFHLQLLPTHFALSIIRLRSGVPMSSAAECLLLIFAFEILKEAGARSPENLGTALSIVGGLVVGQSAVEARIISAPMLIAVALGSICGLMVPRLKGVVFYLRIACVLASSVLGLYGYLAVCTVFLIRVLNLSSLGEDYTVSLKKPIFKNLKDTVIRASWTSMIRRPAFNKNLIRMENNEEN